VDRDGVSVTATQATGTRCPSRRPSASDAPDCALSRVALVADPQRRGDSRHHGRRRRTGRCAVLMQPRRDAVDARDVHSARDPPWPTELHPAAFGRAAGSTYIDPQDHHRRRPPTPVNVCRHLTRPGRPLPAPDRGGAAPSAEPRTCPPCARVISGWPPDRSLFRRPNGAGSAALVARIRAQLDGRCDLAGRLDPIPPGSEPCAGRPVTASPCASRVGRADYAEGQSRPASSPDRTATHPPWRGSAGRAPCAQLRVGGRRGVRETFWRRRGAVPRPFRDRPPVAVPPTPWRTAPVRRAGDRASRSRAAVCGGCTLGQQTERCTLCRRCRVRRSPRAVALRPPGQGACPAIQRPREYALHAGPDGSDLDHMSRPRRRQRPSGACARSIRRDRGSPTGRVLRTCCNPLAQLRYPVKRAGPLARPTASLVCINLRRVGPPPEAPERPGRRRAGTRPPFLRALRVCGLPVRPFD